MSETLSIGGRFLPAAVLGEVGFKQLQEYQRNESMRRVVERFVADLTLTDSPVSPEQTKQLVAILERSGLVAKPALDDARWPEILAQAGGILTARQLAVLKRQADEVERYALGEVVSRLLREQAGQGTPEGGLPSR